MKKLTELTALEMAEKLEQELEEVLGDEIFEDTCPECNGEGVVKNIFDGTTSKCNFPGYKALDDIEVHWY